MLDAVGGIRALMSELPPSWFAIGDYGAGVIIRAGVLPESEALRSRGATPVLAAGLRRPRQGAAARASGKHGHSSARHGQRGRAGMLRVHVDT